MTKSAGIALNVWQEGDTWLMSLYPESEAGIDCSSYIRLDYTRRQLQRYFDITTDDDWWTSDMEELKWILFGARP
jgi:hypothetical protein